MPDATFDSKPFLATLTTRPGVYRMLDASSEIIYVGKARNLKARVSSYFNASNTTIKGRAMVAQVAEIEVTVTATEGEALLLESNLIKAHRPRFNVVLRDDKSYPYIFVSTEDEYPRLAFHRGAKRRAGRYFGPYPSASAVRETLNLMQKLFLVRQCRDSFFNNRSRPCLQYQIKRCTAPCVELISPEAYRRDVEDALLFLAGKSSQLADTLMARMEQAAERLEFEVAARYRDQLAQLRKVAQRQYVEGEAGDCDVIACVIEGGICCVQLFAMRDGRNLGNKALYPKLPQLPKEEALDPAAVLAAFLPQYYIGREIPPEIICSHELEEAELIGSALSEAADRRVTLSARVRGERARWLKLAQTNAESALAARLATRAGMRERLEELQEVLALDELPARMECFDISHTMGEATVASCVVFDRDGPLKSDYRRFNISAIEPGDDYAAMHQALTRRYQRLKRGEAALPDLLFIDGGKGQVGQAKDVLQELEIDAVLIVGVAKGPERKPGLETLIPADGEPFDLPASSAALHLIQQIRDEAHRFAITGHRQRRAKARTESSLEGIPGLGPKRRQALLTHFGGLHGVTRAGVEDLARVKGISAALAQTIYDTFHGE